MSKPSCSPRQNWSHATNSVHRLKKALDSPKISAIETDFIMGHVKNQPKHRFEAICSHPPFLESDLSAKHFLDLVTDDTGSQILRKHIKLDFKDLDVMQILMQLLSIYFSPTKFDDIPVSKKPRKAVILNADIFQGPGLRGKTGSVDADRFTNLALNTINNLQDQGSTQPFILSIGFKVDYTSMEAYTAEDCATLTEYIYEYKLHEQHVGIVIALNARLLSVNPAAFDKCLLQFPHTQVQAWQGTNEPDVPATLVEKIREHYESYGLASRLGFDCTIVD